MSGPDLSWAAAVAQNGGAPACIILAVGLAASWILHSLLSNAPEIIRACAELVRATRKVSAGKSAHELAGVVNQDAWELRAVEIEPQALPRLTTADQQSSFSLGDQTTDLTASGEADGST